AVLPPASLAEVLNRAEQLRETIRTRNLAEYVAAAATGVAFAFMLTTKAHTPLLRIGLAMAIGGVVLLGLSPWRGASPRNRTLGMTDRDQVELYRRELARQRDALATVSRWYLGPILPGIAVIVAALPAGPGTVRPIAAVIFMIAFGLAIVWMNR